jgi:hypothetical protein
VRIVLSDGTARTLAWSELAHTAGPALGDRDLNGTAPATPSTPAPAPAPAPAGAREATAEPATVPLHVEGHGFVLEIATRAPGIGANVRGTIEPILERGCELPCTLTLRPGPNELYGRSLASWRFRDVWSGEVPATGASLDLWQPTALAQSTDARPQVAEARAQVRELLARSTEWERAYARNMRATRDRRLGGILAFGLGLGVAGLGLLSPLVLPHDCSSGLLAHGCEAVPAAITISVIGAIAAIIGGVMYWSSPLSNVRGLDYPRPDVPDVYSVLIPAAR